jgi:hypothetical protein
VHAKQILQGALIALLQALPVVMPLNLSLFVISSAKRA